MSDIKISEMPEATELNNNDLLMIVQNGVNKKIKTENTGISELQTSLQQEILGVQTDVEQKISEMLKLVFPVGSTYITQEEINPNTILNFGTWERLKGKVSLGLDEEDENLNTIGNIGGEKSHRITASELPYKMDSQRNSDTGSDWNTQGVQEFPDSKKMSIMQPYEIVGYMWIRRT